MMKEHEWNTKSRDMMEERFVPSLIAALKLIEDEHNKETSKTIMFLIENTKSDMEKLLWGPDFN